MDRRVIWAVALMMLIALAPTFLMKKPAGGAGRTGGTGRKGRTLEETVQAAGRR